MPKRKASPWTSQPHLVGVEDQLRERKGVLLIGLLTDEAGALMLRNGEVPLYIIDQCEKALDWAGTEYRNVVVGEKMNPPNP